MNVERVVAQLRLQYSGKNIIKLPPENPTEIICEIGSTSDHPEWSVAVAVVDGSSPHFHRESEETYEVLKGQVRLYIDRDHHVLKEGETYTIEPGKVHWATGNSAWVKVKSVPGWTPKDHNLVLSPKE